MGGGEAVVVAMNISSLESDATGNRLRQVHIFTSFSVAKGFALAFR